MLGGDYAMSALIALESLTETLKVAHTSGHWDEQLAIAMILLVSFDTISPIALARSPVWVHVVAFSSRVQANRCKELIGIIAYILDN